MSLEAAAAQLEAMDKIKPKSGEQTVKQRASQEEIIYHQCATITVNKELYAVDVMQVKEVLRYSEITPVPGSDYYICGIINLRGNVVTVIDTRRLFSMPSVPVDDDTRIIVVEYNEQEVIGMVVDSVDEVINLPQNEVERAPNVAGEESNRRFVQGVSYHDNVLTILLDLGKMLTTITPATEEEH